MSFFQSLKTIPLYVNYYLRVVDQHSIQAPYIFQIYSKLLNGIENNNGIEEIENIREALLSDNSIIKDLNFGAGSKVSKSHQRSISSIARSGISSKKDCIFLRELININKPKSILELGTALGISTAYLAISAPSAKVISLEGNVGLIKKATEISKQLYIQNIEFVQGDIDLTLSEFIRLGRKIDMAIIDANHTGQALLRYFDMIHPIMTRDGIMVIDDIRWSKSMYNGWREIIQSKEVTISLEFQNMGLLFFRKGMQNQHYVLSY